MKKIVFLIFMLITIALLAQPSSPVLSEPPDESENVSLTPFFDWNDVTNRYEIRIYEGDIMAYGDDEIEDSYYQLDPTTPLRKGTTYTWKVRAYDSSCNCWGNWSDIWSFTTETGDQFIIEGGFFPNTYVLYQNYPNPFNPATDIKYDIPKESFVEIVIYDLLGRQIAVLVNEIKKPGRYSAVWGSENLPSGVYIYRMTAGNYERTMKMVLLK